MCYDDALYKFTFYLLTYLLTRLTSGQVVLRPARLVPGWMTMVSVRSQPPRSTQPGHPSLDRCDEDKYRCKLGMWSGVALDTGFYPPTSSTDSEVNTLSTFLQGHDALYLYFFRSKRVISGVRLPIILYGLRVSKPRFYMYVLVFLFSFCYLFLLYFSVCDCYYGLVPETNF